MSKVRGKNEETKINNSYSSKMVLAIFTEEIFEKDLPKIVEPPNFNNKDNVNAGHITTDNQNSDEKNKSPNFNNKDEPPNFNNKNEEYNLEERVSQLFTD